MIRCSRRRPVRRRSWCGSSHSIGGAEIGRAKSDRQLVGGVAQVANRQLKAGKPALEHRLQPAVVLHPVGQRIADQADVVSLAKLQISRQTGSIGGPQERCAEGDEQGQAGEDLEGASKWRTTWAARPRDRCGVWNMRLSLKREGGHVAGGRAQAPGRPVGESSLSGSPRENSTRLCGTARPSSRRNR